MSKDRRRYFDQLAATSRKYYMPWLSSYMRIGGGISVLEIGCGEGGNLLPFAQAGCSVLGVDLAEGKIRAAEQFFAEEGTPGRFLASDIFEVKEMEGQFDLIICHDVIEHIMDKEEFMRRVRRYLAPDGLAFFAFPAWQMPFGGHQQNCRSRVLSHLPYFHLLPKNIYRWILKRGGESPEAIKELLEIKQTERHLWEKIQHKTLQGRRTGVGITAEGDMLAALGLRYGTDEATDYAESVQKALALAAYRSSVHLAKERGAFEVFDAKREENNPFINRLREADPSLYTDMVKYGRRNIACLTIAPTGTTSLMTQTTSGIEPVFLPVYKRRRKVNPNDAEARVDFVDETGDAFEEYIVFHHKFVTWMQANGYSTTKKYSQEEVDELVAKSPYFKATSNDVDWLQKVRMQGRIQKWVDHSISVTINLPNNVTEDLVDSLYVEAWRCGCKGCTVYRDGSRAGVLLATDKKKKDDCNCMQPPIIVSTRPRELEADVVKFQNNRERWIAFVGLLNGRPYEIFTGLADDDEGIMLPKHVSKGSIIKNYDEDGKKHYDFQFKNKRGYKMTIEGLDGKFNPEYWNYAKLISGVLRYGMPIDQVIKLIQGMELNSESINTWKNGVERALKKYLPNGTEAKGQKCPNCGLETLVYQEGCLICTNCGASKCG